MHQTNKTPAGIAGQTGASGDSFAGASHFPLSLDAHRAQFLMLAFAVRPEIAAMLAAAVFGGGHG